MSDARDDRPCGKQGYDSAAQARKAAEATRRRRGPSRRAYHERGLDGPVVVSVYRCAACARWHWGHLPKRSYERSRP